MFCKQCGTQMAGGEKFCPGCGAPVDAPPAPAVPTPAPVAPAPAPMAPPPVPVAPVAPSPAPAAGNPLALRSGPLFLTAVICMSVVVLFQLISIFTSIGTMGQMSEAMDMMGMGDAGGALTGVSVLTILVSLGTLAIAAVILVGLWMTYASGLGGGKAPMLDRGLKMIRGGVMAQMIYLIVVLSFAVLIFLLAAIVGGTMAGSIGSYDYYDYYEYRSAAAGLGAATAIIVVMLVFLVGFGALMIAFYVKARAAAGYALTTAGTGRVTGVPSMFLVVMCFVIGGFGLLGALLGGAVLGVMYVLSAMASAAASILFGVVALQYRNRALAAG